MQRLIDANALKKLIAKHVYPVADAFNSRDYGMFWTGGIEKAIDETPTVDAVEVVRCKECKYAHMTYGGECKSCDKWVDDDDFHLTLYLDGNFYCAFGERRADEPKD